MKWTNRRRSSNVEDRRGQSTGGFPVGMAGTGIGGIIISIVIFLLFGQNLQQRGLSRYDELFDYVSVVLADPKTFGVFEDEGLVYQPPILVVFEDQVQSACGYQSAAVGPFYCPADQKVYIDLSFYDQLSTQFGVSGDFAMAYVVAHEVGHHVQTLLGINDQMSEIRSKVSETEFNRYSVAFELQADYLSGVWAHHISDQGLLEEGDLDEALNAASAIGDDAIQKQSQGYVVPDSFTHGTSEQRKYWFYHGFEMGDG